MNSFMHALCSKQLLDSLITDSCVYHERKKIRYFATKLLNLIKIRFLQILNNNRKQKTKNREFRYFFNDLSDIANLT